MTDFDSWFRQQVMTVEEFLPEGITERDGVYFAACCCCGKHDEIPVDLSEIPATGYQHFCGGSPRCCP